MELSETIESEHAILICCSDPRLHPSSNGLEARISIFYSSGKGVYLISSPGASKDLVVGDSVAGSEEIKNNFLRNIGIFVNSHKNKDIAIFICHHRDCKAYEYYLFDSPKEERETQTEHMRMARDIIMKEFPGVKVVLLWDNLLLRNNGGENGIERIS